MAVNNSTNIEIENETFVADEVIELSPSILNISTNVEDGIYVFMIVQML